MAAVMIGVDPHKASHTAVAIGAALRSGGSSSLARQRSLVTLTTTATATTLTSARPGPLFDPHGAALTDKPHHDLRGEQSRHPAFSLTAARSSGWS